MTVVEQMSENAVSLDQFPIGMRVLAVDDDPTCLKVLESLLQKCQYQVTVTSRAIEALQLLRESPNMFDLVISDVNMPDIDGFKLLELVGLEMDLPVIMLSAHSDTELVMKGVTHGACDYLLKPVRIEELKNIWQHVVRRKHLNLKCRGHCDKACLETGGGDGWEQSAKHLKKRKEKEEDEEDDSEDESGPENDELVTQKRTRVVWTPELHKKFIDAIMHLGYDKAFPKKILDVMNVEGLTRENVASHLQKFRQLLKKVEDKPQDTDSVLGIKDVSYMRTGYLGPTDFGDSRSLTPSQRLTNTSLSAPSISHRLNSPHGLTMTRLTPPFSAGKFPPTLQNQTLYQRFPPSLELSQFQPPSSNPLGELNRTLSTAPRVGFSGLTGFQGATGTAFGGASNARSIDLGTGGLTGSSSFLDWYRCNEPWPSTVQPSSVIPLTTSSFFGGGGGGGSSSLTPLPASLNDAGDGFFGNMIPANNSNSNFGAAQTWEGGFNINNNNVNQNFGAFNSQSLDQNNIGGNTLTASIFDPSGRCPSSGNDMEISASETTAVKSGDASLSGQGKQPQDGPATSTYDSLDDILNSLIKRDQNDTVMSSEFGFDNFPLGSSM